MHLISAAGLAIAVLIGCGTARAGPYEEAVNLFLLGSSEDRLGLVTIPSDASCAVKLENRRNPDFAVIDFSSFKQVAVEVKRVGRRSYLRMAGSKPFVELHSATAVLRTQTAEISTGNPERDLAALGVIRSVCAPSEDAVGHLDPFEGEGRGPQATG